MRASTTPHAQANPRTRFEAILAAIEHFPGGAPRLRLDKKAAAAYVRQTGAAVPEPDRARFAEIVETELMSLHEGNIARYRIQPSVFREWREGWR